MKERLRGSENGWERETECQREGMRVSERENESVRDRERQRER